jgi:hypothetical protein
MRRGTLLIALACASVARADGRGQGLYQQHCARCHVVGQGAQCC